jgi:hypothetical protein
VAYRTMFGAVCMVWAALASAQSSIVFSEPRDAAAAYLGTTNFVIGRVARDCLEVLKEPESFVQAHVKSWQLRNQNFYAATTAYMTLRLKDAEARGGVKARDAVYRAYTNAVRGDGELTVEDLFKRGTKEEACRRHVALVKAGELDVRPDRPFYLELTKLVDDFEAAK